MIKFQCTNINRYTVCIMMCPTILYLTIICSSCSPWNYCIGKDVRNLTLYNVTIRHDNQTKCPDPIHWPKEPHMRPCNILLGQCMNDKHEYVCDIVINNEYDTSENKFRNDLLEYTSWSWHYVIYKNHQKCDIINNNLYILWYLGVFSLLCYIYLILSYIIYIDNPIPGYEIIN